MDRGCEGPKANVMTMGETQKVLTVAVSSPPTRAHYAPKPGGRWQRAREGRPPVGGR